jgi:hypothetical protein
MRAAAVTEAREAGAANADVAKVIGDTEHTAAQVYDRARLAAARRTARRATLIATATETESESGCVQCVARPNGIRGLRWV